jgi:putative sugar O-methyltransferase
MQVIDAKTLMRRTGLTSYHEPALPMHNCPTPEGVREYLKQSNERLVYLQAKYSRVSAAAMNHSQWRREYIMREIDLEHFRADSAYMWQRRDFNFPINYLCTYYYIKQSAYGRLLELCTEDKLFGIQAIELGDQVITRDRLDSVCELSFLQMALELKQKSRLRILDIGSGYGRFAHRAVQCFPSMRVLCADAIPESSFLCEFYLRFRGVDRSAKIVELHELTATTISENRVDLAVAINSLSECSASAISWWLELLAESKVRYLFFIPHSGYEGGKLSFSAEINCADPADIMQLIHRHGYKVIVSMPKYDNPLLQDCGVSPSYHYLFERQR